MNVGMNCIMSGRYLIELLYTYNVLVLKESNVFAQYSEFNYILVILNLFAFFEEKLKIRI